MTAPDLESGKRTCLAAPGSSCGDQLSGPERIRVVRDAIFNNLGRVVSAVTGIVLVPVLWRALGAEAYGLWLAAAALAGVIATFDLGLSWTLSRGVSTALARREQDQITNWTSTAALVYLILGCLGAFAVAGAGYPFGARLRLAPDLRSELPLVFALVALGFLAGRINAFLTGVFVGLRRFDVSNMLATVSTLIRAGGILLLASRKSLPAIVAWDTVVGFVSAAMCFIVLRKLLPGFRLSLRQFDMNLLRRNWSFALNSQLEVVVSGVLTNLGVLAIGTICGSGAIFAYEIGQKFPTQLSNASWSAAEVLFPAASEHSGQAAKTEGLLEAGTRYLLLLLLPVAALLYVCAPALVQLWIGTAQPEAVMICRLLTIVVAVEAVGLPAFHVLWGQGSAGAVVTIQVVRGVITIIAVAGLVKLLGPVGAAWGLLAGFTLFSCAVLFLVRKRYGVHGLSLLRNACRGLFPAMVVCASSASLLLRLFSVRGWTALAGICAACALLFGCVFYFLGARVEEQIFIRQLLSVPPRLLQALLSRSLGPSAGGAD